MAIDFAAIAARLLSQSRSILQEWYPAGKFVGHEFKIGDIYGSDGNSCSINVNTGQWSDFANGQAGGDLISLYAAREGITQADAAKYLGGELELRPAIAPQPKPEEPKPEWRAILPVPADAPPPTNDYYRRGQSADGQREWIKLQFIARWPYRDASGALLGYAVRYQWEENGETRKDIVPQTFCVDQNGKREWRWKAFPSLRPLYGLDHLAARPAAPVMIVEGEKKVEALKALAPQYVGVAWPGGAAAWRKVDWSPLNGRSICCWPDADKQIITTQVQAERFGLSVGERIPRDSQPGMRAMWEIGHMLLKRCPSVKIIVPDDETLPDGWDCADALRDGWDWPRLKAWAVPRIHQLQEGNSDAEGKRRRELEREGGGGHSADRKAVAREAAPEAQGDSYQDRGGDAVGAGRGGSEPRDRDEQPADPQREGTPQTDRGDAPGHGSAGQGDRRATSRAAGREGGDAAAGALSRSVSRDDGRSDIRTQKDSAQAAPASQIARWLAFGLERNGNGLPLTTLSNATRVLELDEKLQGLVWYDDFLQRIMRLDRDGPREWTDSDDINLTLYMQREIGLSKIGRDVVSLAVIAFARRDVRHCVRDWLGTLKWDRVLRIDEFMIKVFGADDTPFVRAVSRNFFLGLVARVYEPGCKQDNIIVLEGAQGISKSSALMALVGARYYTEQHESATNVKAFAEILQGKWLVEVSEMDAFARAEVTRVKQVASCQSDRYRDSYARYASDHPRQCSMTATANKDDWNRDETGARRFWPVACRGMADLAYVRAWREQLFAEAVEVYLRAGVRCEPEARVAAGAAWWVVPDAAARIEQRKRYDADPWIEPISHWLSGRTEVTVNEIAIACLKMELREVDRGRQMRIAGCLRALGWINNGNAKRAGRVVKTWTPPADEYLVSSDYKAQDDEVATQRSLPEDDIPFQ